jgi:hypothetical protein
MVMNLHSHGHPGKGAPSQRGSGTAPAHGASARTRPCRLQVKLPLHGPFKAAPGSALKFPFAFQLPQGIPGSFSYSGFDS